MTTPEVYVVAGFVAGYRWVPPAEQSWVSDLPATVATVSDCLAEFLLADDGIQAWQQSLFEPCHSSLTSAANAVRQAPPNTRLPHVLSMSVPTPWAPALAGMLTTWIDDLPHPIQVNLSRRAPAPPGTAQGFEILGFGAGRFHSWLCYRLDVQGRDELGSTADRPGC